jgi:hypothetical protein
MKKVIFFAALLLAIAAAAIIAHGQTTDLAVNKEITAASNDISNTSNSDIIDKRTWNAKTYADGDKYTTEFHSKWIHYLDDNWKDIDTSFYETNNGFAMTNAPFYAYAPMFSTGTATFENNNRWNVFNHTVIAEGELNMTIAAMNVKNVRGKIMRGDLLVPSGLQRNVSYVIYENAYKDGDLIYYVDFGTAPKLEKLIKLNRRPAQLEYKFRLWYSSPVAFEMANGKKWDETGTLETDGNQLKSWKEGSADRGIAFKQFRIWDSNTSFLNVSGERNIKPIQSTLTSLGGNEYILTKELPPDFFDNTVYPVFTDTTSTFYPDAHTETTTVDGEIQYNQASSWSEAHDAASGPQPNPSGSFGEFAYSAYWSGYYYIVRSIFLFDTSSLTSSANISSATISIYGYGTVNNADGDYAYIVNSAPASNTDITSSDYSTLGTTSYSNAYAFSSWSTSAYNDFTLNNLGRDAISKTGVSKFGARDWFDIMNSAPSGFNQLQTRWAENSGTSQDPKLVVTYTLPTTNTCTYSSGNWNIQCSDGCNITTPINMQKNNVIFNGTGVVQVNSSSIFNYTVLQAVNSCTVRFRIL